MAAIVDAFGGVDITMTGEEVYQLNANLWALSQEVEDEKEKGSSSSDTVYAEIKATDYIPDVNGEINIQYGEYEDGTYHLNGNQAVAYGRIYILGSVFVLLVMGMNPFITTQGFAKISMLTTVIGAVINIILDPIFIFVLDLGVRGAALATVLSQAVGAVWILRFLT